MYRNEEKYNPKKNPKTGEDFENIEEEEKYLGTKEPRDPIYKAIKGQDGQDDQGER